MKTNYKIRISDGRYCHSFKIELYQRVYLWFTWLSWWECINVRSGSWSQTWNYAMQWQKEFSVSDANIEDRSSVS